MADEVNSAAEGDSGEDVPNNFFDDFDKDEFMDGLKVIDSVQEKDEEEEPRRRSGSISRRSKISNPCSQRRDLEKTKAAILRDKEAKVKEHLAKQLESKDDIRPPGTELDDFFDKVRPSNIRKKSSPEHEDHNKYLPESRKRRDPESPRWESPPKYMYYKEDDKYYTSGRGMRKVYNSGPKHMHHDNFDHSYRHYNHRYSPRYSPHRSSRHFSQKYSWHKSQHSPPARYRQSPQRHSLRGSHHSPRYSPRHSPSYRNRRSPHYSPRFSPRRSPMRHSHYSPRHSPWRHSRPRSHQSPSRRSRKMSRRSSSYSPRPHSKPKAEKEHYSPDRSVRWSPKYEAPENSQYTQDSSQQFVQPQYNPDMSNTNIPYMYPPAGEYNTYMASAQSGLPMIPPGPQNMLLNSMGAPDMSMAQPVTQVMPIPQPVPLPDNPIPSNTIDQCIPQPNFMAPQAPMVPHPSIVPSAPLISQVPLHVQDVEKSYEALVQLVAEGKLSHEDFLKLAPNIKGSNNSLDDQTKKVVSRCHYAVQRLAKLLKPNRLVLKRNECSTENNSFSQKYCSPLKRQLSVEFEVTSTTQKNVHNKLLIDNIISMIGLEKSVMGIPEAKDNMKSVGVQTTTPYCDVCEIQESLKKSDAATSTVPGAFSSTVHTQVVEEDLLNSQAVFNPSGSVGDGAPISIAHLTPAQLVSQLAARAKSFQQTDSMSQPQQYRRWKPPNDYDSRGGSHHFNQNNRYRF